MLCFFWMNEQLLGVSASQIKSASKKIPKMIFFGAGLGVFYRSLLLFLANRGVLPLPSAVLHFFFFINLIISELAQIAACQTVFF